MFPKLSTLQLRNFKSKITIIQETLLIQIFQNFVQNAIKFTPEGKNIIIKTIPNNQVDFANWLYMTPKTCKEGNGNQCVGNNRERLNGNSYQFI